jgi:hypothetical protein
VLYRGPRKDRWSRRDDGRAWNVIMDWGARWQLRLGRRGHLAGTSGRP